MKLIKVIVLTLLIFMGCTGCSLFLDQEYTCDIDKIESVQIIRLGEYNQEELEFEYTVLCDILDWRPFVERLLDMECRVNWGEPNGLYVGDIVIRIAFQDGYVDYISDDAQWIERDDITNGGFFWFDREVFKALIEEYLENQMLVA